MRYTWRVVDLIVQNSNDILALVFQHRNKMHTFGSVNMWVRVVSYSNWLSQLIWFDTISSSRLLSPVLKYFLVWKKQKTWVIALREDSNKNIGSFHICFLPDLLRRKSFTWSTGVLIRGVQFIWPLTEPWSQVIQSTFCEQSHADAKVLFSSEPWRNWTTWQQQKKWKTSSVQNDTSNCLVAWVFHFFAEWYVLEATFWLKKLIVLCAQDWSVAMFTSTNCSSVPAMQCTCLFRSLLSDSPSLYYLPLINSQLSELSRHQMLWACALVWSIHLSGFTLDMNYTRDSLDSLFWGSEFSHSSICSLQTQLSRPRRRAHSSCVPGPTGEQRNQVLAAEIYIFMEQERNFEKLAVLHPQTTRLFRKRHLLNCWNEGSLFEQEWQTLTSIHESEYLPWWCVCSKNWQGHKNGLLIDILFCFNRLGDNFTNITHKSFAVPLEWFASRQLPSLPLKTGVFSVICGFEGLFHLVIRIFMLCEAQFNVFRLLQQRHYLSKHAAARLAKPCNVLPDEKKLTEGSFVRRVLWNSEAAQMHAFSPLFLCDRLLCPVE